MNLLRCSCVLALFASSASAGVTQAFLRVDIHAARDAESPIKEAEGEADEEGHNHMKNLRDETAITAKKASEMSPYRTMRHDAGLFKKYLMPGKTPDFSKKALELLASFIAILWFALSKKTIFKNDLNFKIKDFEKQIEASDVDNDTDMVLVFHRPDYERPDKDNIVSQDVLHRVYLKQDAKDAWTRSMSLLDQTQGASLGDARTALLQDLYEKLPHKGFELQVESSVNDTELHVSIALTSDETIRHILQSKGLQLQIQRDVIKTTLNIDQESGGHDFSAPFIKYDHERAVNVLGEGKTDFDLFEVYRRFPGERGSLIPGEMRIQIILSWLKKYVDLDFAVGHGLLLKWFPAHNAKKITAFKKTWANWSLLKDFSFLQPLSSLNLYFGSRVTFIFAWNGHYCRALLALMPPALLFWGGNIVAHALGRNSYWNRGSVLGFSIVIAIWARFSFNVWCRREAHMGELWDVNNCKTDRTPMVEFYGDLRKCIVDANTKELVYPRWKKTLRRACSWFVTLVFCVVNLLVVMAWLGLFGGRLNPVASIVQALIVQVFTFMFDFLVEKLTIAENHQYRDDYYNSYLIKNFIFQFVNQYAAFFYIAVKQQFTNQGCMHGGDCVIMLNQYIPTTLLILALMRVALVVMATWKIKLLLWWETRKIVPPPVISYVAEQTKYDSFRIREQVEVMTSLVITLGYVLIFGAVAPIIVPLCFLIFAVQLRASAVVATSAANRTVPALARGIGAWEGAIQFLTVFGIFFSAYLCVQFGPIFDGTLILTKLTFLCLYALTLGLLGSAVNVLCPKDSHNARIIDVRREHVRDKLIEKEQKSIVDRLVKVEDELADMPGRKMTSHGGHFAKVVQEAACAKEIAAGNWKAIPKFSGKMDTPR